MGQKTKFQKHKTFKNRSDAEKHIEKIGNQFPNRTFSVKERRFYNKHKVRFTVRSVNL